MIPMTCHSMKITQLTGLGGSIAWPYAFRRVSLQYLTQPGQAAPGPAVIPLAHRTDQYYERNRTAQRERNTRSNPHHRSRSGKHSQLSLYLRGEPVPFISWDGEGYNAFAVGSDGVCTIRHRYMLFGSSHSKPVLSIDLSTVECLSAILACKRENPKSIHTAFAFEYDVNMICKDLSKRRLSYLRAYGKCLYKGFRIKHIPHKIFSVSKDGVSVTIFDSFGYFGCAYLTALRRYGIGTKKELAIIEAGKKERGHFNWFDREYVEKYWRYEISLHPLLMDKVRDACYNAGYNITSWHGPGTLASWYLKKMKVSNWHGKNVPAPVQIARRYAYAGGRFQQFMGGYYIGPVYVADVNSAYAYACSLLPRLDNGTWRSVDPRSITPANIPAFGLYRIRFHFQGQSDGIPMPLFHRDKSNRLSWPNRVEGWFWGPEARNVAGTAHARILEAWVFDSDNTRPFQEWIQGAYNRRLDLQEKGDPVEKAYKWMLAAVYGAFARRVGWDRRRRRAPQSHQIEWAGFITSLCRSMVWEAASYQHYDTVVSIDTDGVTSLRPFGNLPNGEGTGLGQWKVEEYTGILMWQSGIYWLRNKDGEWEDPKSRGIPKGKIPMDVVEQTMVNSFNMADLDTSYFTISKTTFTGYGRALRGQMDEWRTWKPMRLKVLFGGTGKTRHAPKICRYCNPRGSAPMHTMTVMPVGVTDQDNEPHRLPWLEKVQTLEGVEQLDWDIAREDIGPEDIFENEEIGEWA
jgi:hypothetical protein